MMTIQDLNKYSDIGLTSITLHRFEGWVTTSRVVDVELMDSHPLLYSKDIRVGYIIDNEEFIKHIIVRDYSFVNGEAIIIVSLQEYQED